MYEKLFVVFHHFRNILAQSSTLKTQPLCPFLQQTKMYYMERSRHNKIKTINLCKNRLSNQCWVKRYYEQAFQFGIDFTRFIFNQLMEDQRSRGHNLLLKKLKCTIGKFLPLLCLPQSASFYKKSKLLYQFSTVFVLGTFIIFYSRLLSGCCCFFRGEQQHQPGW